MRHPALPLRLLLALPLAFPLALVLAAGCAPPREERWDATLDEPNAPARGRDAGWEDDEGEDDDLDLEDFEDLELPPRPRPGDGAATDDARRRDPPPDAPARPGSAPDARPALDARPSARADAAPPQDARPAAADAAPDLAPPPAACVPGGPCGEGCTLACPGGVPAPCVCRADRLACEPCRAPTPDAGGTLPGACPANPAGAACAPTGSACQSEGHGARPAICFCAPDGRWACPAR
jgi:hypothetical protein